MDTATQAQLALLKRLLDQGRLTEAEYQVEVAALEGSPATFDQREQTVESQTNAGRDSIDLNGDANVVGSHNLVQLYHVYQNPPGKQRLTEDEFGKVLADYLAWVHLEYGRTRLHGLQNLQQTGALDKPLTTIYTSLQVEHRPAVEPGGDLRRGQRQALSETEPRELPPLDMADLLTLGERIAIIGKAGSGKTTYLAFVASTLAGALLGQPLDVRLKPPQPDDVLPVPLLAPLRFWQVYREQCRQVNRYEKPEAGTLGAFLLWFLKGRYKNFDAAEDFFERLLRGGRGALILLDGLDEVVQVTERRVVRDEVERLLTSQYPGNRCLVTAREAGYRDAPFGGDFILCRVQPLNQEQIAALVGAWCVQIYAQPHDGTSACEDLVGVIARLNAERERRKQPPLIDTPLLVTMVVSVKYSRYELPRERAKLYDACVDVILSSEYTGREDDAGARQGVVNAGGPPDKQRGWLAYLAFQMHQGGEAGASLDEGGVQRILTPVFEQRGETAMLEPFLAAAGHRGGLFEERGGRYQFTHLTFQEYLAAQFLSRQWNRQPRGFLAQIVTEEWWREAVLLTIGNLDDPAPFEQRAEFIGALCQLQGDMSARLAAAELAATGLNELPAPEPALLQLARQRLVELWRAPDFSSALPKVRLAAGNALAVLGDDRDFDALVKIPAGPFLMGEGKEQHQVTLDAFRIGKYPVTVGQFRRFVETSGYQLRDPDCLRGIATHPVVLVTWHDARAYCAWLTQEWRQAGKIAANEEVRLPTEAEWEKVASWDPGGKGRKREFPWGDEWDATKCNTSESGLGTTSPVGMYPEGASAYGCLDMAGNVWEWTSSLYGLWNSKESKIGRYFSYPYNDSDGRERIDVGDIEAIRVLRGGAFDALLNLARCAARYWYLPDSLGDLLGFRVVVSPSREAPTLHFGT